MMTILLQILAVILGGIAAYFLWADNLDWAFAFVVFAVCSFFLGMRFQIKVRMADRTATEPPQDERDQ